jgi:hypothetical protein
MFNAAKVSVTHYSPREGRWDYIPYGLVLKSEKKLVTYVMLFGKMGLHTI